MLIIDFGKRLPPKNESGLPYLGIEWVPEIRVIRYEHIYSMYEPAVSPEEMIMETR